MFETSTTSHEDIRNNESLASVEELASRRGLPPPSSNERPREPERSGIDPMIQARMTAGKGGKAAIKALKDQATQDICGMLSK